MNSSEFFEDCLEVGVSSELDVTGNFSCTNITSLSSLDTNGVNVTPTSLISSSQLPPQPLLRFINVTNQLPIHYALPMYGYVMPVLLVVTIVANTLIVVVLSKRHMRTPTNLVLMAMALSDMFTLLVPAPWLFYLYTLGNHNKPLYPVAACYSYQIMQEVLPNLFHTASIWLTLALALQRYIYVCLPPLARTWCTVPKVKRGIVWVYVLAAAHQSTRFADYVYFGTEVEWEGSTTWVCGWRFAPWVVDFLTVDVYFNIYYWFRILFVHCVPCALLVVLNVLLFAAMRRAQRKRERLFYQPPKDSTKTGTTMTTNHKRSSECRKLRDSNCTTLMLIVVVTVFLCVEIPLAVITLLHTVQSTFGSHLLDYLVANALILFTNFFIMLSYPINFAIYCGMSRQFRETFKELFISGGSACGVGGGGGLGGASVVGGASCVDGRGCRDGSSRYSLVNGPTRTTTNCTNETIL